MSQNICNYRSSRVKLTVSLQLVFTIFNIKTNLLNIWSSFNNKETDIMSLKFSSVTLIKLMGVLGLVDYPFMEGT